MISWQTLSNNFRKTLINTFCVAGIYNNHQPNHLKCNIASETSYFYFQIIKKVEFSCQKSTFESSETNVYAKNFKSPYFWCIYDFSKSGFWTFWHEKPSKTLFRVTYVMYFLQPEVCRYQKLKVSLCQNLLFGPKTDF